LSTRKRSPSRRSVGSVKIIAIPVMDFILFYLVGGNCHGNIVRLSVSAVIKDAIVAEQYA
jgi:hypothetical protein